MKKAPEKRADYTIGIAQPGLRSFKSAVVINPSPRNRHARRVQEHEEAPPAPQEDIVLLREIRDALKK